MQSMHACIAAFSLASKGLAGRFLAKWERLLSLELGEARSTVDGETFISLAPRSVSLCRSLCPVSLPRVLLGSFR